MRADSRAAEIQREAYALISGLAMREVETLSAYTGKCDAGVPLAGYETVDVSIESHGDVMMHVSIPARDFEYEASRYNAYCLLSDIKCFGVDFALRSIGEFFGI